MVINNLTKYAVFGNPIQHSLSPQIHQNFAKQFSLNIDYQKIIAEIHNFDTTINKFIKNGGVGFNITAPFKKQAFNICTKTTTVAQIACSVNTIKVSNNQLIGDNTDGNGLVTDLNKNLKCQLKDATILILGAGGASSGILYAMLAEKPHKIMIANRSAEKAIKLAKNFAKYGNTCGFGLHKIKPTPVDIIINATSASLTNTMLDLPDGVACGALCYDLMYNAKTPFISWAMINGAKKAIDGLGMLVEQAALAFEFWHQKKPDTSGILNELKSTT